MAPVITLVVPVITLVMPVIVLVVPVKQQGILVRELVTPETEIAEYADAAFWLAGEAKLAAKQNQTVADADPMIFGNDLH